MKRPVSPPPGKTARVGTPARCSAQDTFTPLPDASRVELRARLTASNSKASVATVQSIAVGLAGPRHVALATSTFFLSADIGIGVGPVIDGAIAGSIGYPALYGVLSGVAVLGALAYRVVHGRASLREGVATRP